MTIIDYITIITCVWTLLSIPYIVYKWIKNKYFPYNLKFSTVFNLPIEDGNEQWIKEQGPERLLELKKQLENTPHYNQFLDRISTIGLPPYKIKIKNIGNKDVPPCSIKLQKFMGGNIIEFPLIYNTDFPDGIREGCEYLIYVHRFDKPFRIGNSLIDTSSMWNYQELFSPKLDAETWYWRIILTRNNSPDIIYENKMVGNQLFILLKNLWENKNRQLTYPNLFLLNKIKVYYNRNRLVYDGWLNIRQTINNKIDNLSKYV